MVRLAGGVKDTMVAGNITLHKQLIALGSDADWNGSCYTHYYFNKGTITTARS